MRITVLTYLEKKGDTSYDTVADQVANALRAEKHTVKVLAVHGDIVTMVESLRALRPTLVFNLMEAFGGNLFGEIGVAGALQLLGLRYTGGGPGEFYLQQDKALTKERLAFHNVPFPNYAVFRKDHYPDTSGRLRMPLIVKPLRMDASIGIESSSLVRSASTRAATSKNRPNSQRPRRPLESAT